VCSGFRVADLRHERNGAVQRYPGWMKRPTWRIELARVKVQRIEQPDVLRIMRTRTALVERGSSMPAYDYQCNACGCRFQERQKMSDPEIEFCPGCGGTVKRLISGGAGIISKGGGTHSTSFVEAHPSCGLGAPCCGQGGGCNNQEFCDR
jgi:putative FmdB family regulatory protein